MQHDKPTSPISIFCAAAPSDMALLARWETHLLPLQQRGQITVWSERHLAAGASRMEQVAQHLDEAQVIVFLLSSDFFAEDVCMALVERVPIGSARVLPLLVRPVDWQTSRLGDLACLPADGSFVTQWPNQDDALQTCVHELRHLLGLAASVQPQSRQGTSTVARQNRERMLGRLRRSYTEMMSQTLQGAVWLELGLAEKPDAVQNAATLLLRTPKHPEQLLPPGTSILHVYDEAIEALLILGAPGAGKSTLLVELAQQLVARAEANALHPLPVVLPLSSWAVKRPPLHTWLAEQVAQIYGIAKNIARQWIGEDQLLPLLDGLDEVEEAARSACIAAINVYHQDHLRLPLVVCSRQAEYEEASKSQRLALQNAVVVQPLTREHVQAYLKQVGKPLSALRRVLATNSVLAEIAATPLMVHVLSLTYQGTSVRQLSTQNAQLQQQIWADYLARMVERKGDATCYPLDLTRSWLSWLARQMREHNQTVFYLEHIQPDWLTDKQRHVYKWLGVRLPAMMIGALVSIIIGWFFLGFSGFSHHILGWNDLLREATIGGLLGGLLCPMMPSDSAYTAAKTRRRWAIALFTSIGIGSVIGLSIGRGLDADVAFNNWLFNAFIYGVIFSLGTLLLQFLLSASSPRFSLTFRPSSGRRTILQGFIQQEHLQCALSVALLIGLSYGLSTGLSVGLSIGLSYGLSIGLSYGLSIGLGYGLVSLLISVTLKRLQEAIHLTERVAWTWQNLRNHLLAFTHLSHALILTACIAIFVGLSYLLADRLNNWLNNWLRYGLSVGLSVGLLYWLLLGLYQSITQEQIEDQDRRVPNQGIRQSLRNSLLLGLMSGVMIAGMGIVTFGLSIGPSYGLNVGLSNLWLLFIAGSIFAWVITGGLAVWRHYLIRVLLPRTQALPLDVSRFLDNAAACILLRHIGGGYGFVHRLLLDYLADFSTRSTLASTTFSSAPGNAPPANKTSV